MISIGLALPLTFLSTSIVALLFGENYRDAGIVLSIHIWTTVFVSLGVASSSWIIAEGRQLLSLQRTVIGAIINIVLNLLLIPNYGGMGAALATLISQFASCFLFDIIQNVTRRMFFMKLKAMNPLRLKNIFH